jgi:hypothetical protein
VKLTSTYQGLSLPKRACTDGHERKMNRETTV